MDHPELRDADEARAFLAHGLWLQRVVRPAAGSCRPALEWALEVASRGDPLPPVGFVADLGNLVFGTDARPDKTTPVPVPGWPAYLPREYEDYVLGKVYADGSFERAADAARGFKGRDRVRGLAYLVGQLRDRADLPGVLLSPAAVRNLMAEPAEGVLSRAWDEMTRDGPTPRLAPMYAQLVAGFRRVGDLLADEDVTALEQRTALADFGQYVAHRQIVQTVALLERDLPGRPVRPLPGRREVPTRVRDDDVYPIGGYSSISTKGTIESLLHSQLAYMEDDARPDLFDLKQLRDELFYYSRDENQFLRKRRTFAFILFPDLTAARVKDAELPCQRIILVLSTVMVLVRKLSDWLSTDALKFEILFVQPGPERPLKDEAELLATLLREHIERGAATIRAVPNAAEAVTFCNRSAETSQVHGLGVATEPVELDSEKVVLSQLVVVGPRPHLVESTGIAVELDGDDPLEVWKESALHLLRAWV
jgi:hypothetical protein